MSAMRQEWIEFCRQNEVHNGRPDYAIVRTAFYAGWTRAVKRLDLPDPPEPEDSDRWMRAVANAVIAKAKGEPTNV
jgi:hypothetical protein